MPTLEVQIIVRDFVARVVALVEAEIARRLQREVASVMATPPNRLPSKRSDSAPALGSVRRLAKDTTKLAKARRLQGQYLGTMRRLKPAERARVKKLTHEKGVAAGLKLAQSLR
jgi:hypothetical protein